MEDYNKDPCVRLFFAGFFLLLPREKEKPDTQAIVVLVKYSRKKITGGGRGGMIICSKLRQNLSEMEVSTFERIQRVIWDHLLPFKGEIIQKQALFSIG